MPAIDRPSPPTSRWGSESGGEGRRHPSVSRLRSLVRDVCRHLQQQMIYWGWDARHPDGNLLVRFGMQRIGRDGGQVEGSSRYRMPWRDGTVEIHSFCAGWYPLSGEGMLFIRHRERLYATVGREPLKPGFYDADRVAGATSDETLLICRPLLEWVISYEKWIIRNTVTGYRRQCWGRDVAQMGAPRWLSPEQALPWLETFVADPSATPRGRELLRPPKPSGICPRPAPVAFYQRTSFQNP